MDFFTLYFCFARRANLCENFNIYQVNDSETLQSECTAWPNAFKNLNSNCKKIPLSSPPPMFAPLPPFNPPNVCPFAPLPPLNPPPEHSPPNLNTPRLNNPPPEPTYPPPTWTPISPPPEPTPPPEPQMLGE